LESLAFPPLAPFRQNEGKENYRHNTIYTGIDTETSMLRGGIGLPIEQVFAKLKHLLRKAAARTIETVCAAIGEILGAFTPEECANYFRNSGYPT
jgi:uncharacterized SAM-dependent methyltransferase